MKQKETVQSIYEDVVFALWMDHVAEEEGKRALEELEALAQDPSACVPEEVQRKGAEIIQMAFAKRKRKRAAQAVWKVLGRLAVAGLILALVIKGIFIIFPQVRADLYNWYIRCYESWTGRDYLERFADEYISADFTLEPGWLPEGFALVDEARIFTGLYQTYQYQDHEERYIMISRDAIVGGSLSVDTENAKLTDMIFQGREGTLIEKEGWTCIVIPLPERKQIISMDAEGIPAEDLVKVAQNLPL